MKLKVSRKPDFSRVRRALLCEGEPDRVPFIELGIHPVHKSAIIGRPCRTVADEVEFATLAGYDFVKLQPAIDMNPGRIYPAGGPQITAMAGGTEGERRWADEHGGVIATMADFERYVWPRPQDVNYSRLEEACRILPPEMAVIGQYGDIFTFVWEALGFEKFSEALYEDPDLVAVLFDKVGGIIYNLFENMATMDRVGAMWYSDDLAYTAGSMVNPAVYRKHLFPWVKKMGDLCKARDIPFIYHTDGLLWDLLDDLIGCGVTSLHPIEPKAMDIAEVKQRMSGRLAVLGNIEVDLLSRGTPEQVDALVADTIRRAAPGGGFLLGSGNSVPEYVRLENYVAMLEAGDRLGTYPIAG